MRTSLRCFYVYLKRHPAQKTWLSRIVQFKCNTVASFKQTILTLSIFCSRMKCKWGSDDALCYLQPERRIQTYTYQVLLWSFRESLDGKACYKSYHAVFFRVCFSFKRYHTLERPLFKWNYWWQLNNSKHYSLPLFQFFSNYFLQSFKACTFLPYSRFTLTKNSTKKCFWIWIPSVPSDHTKACNISNLIEKGFLTRLTFLCLTAYA